MSGEAPTHVRSGTVPAGTLHFHGCPTCHEKAPCFESCTIEPDLSDERPTGAYGRCADCATAADVLYGIDDPAEALEVLHTRRRWAWSPGDPDAPRWWCITCDGYGRVRDWLAGGQSQCPDCRGLRQHADAPPSLPALVSCANLGTRLVTAVMLARTLAGNASATVILRVESAEWLEAHHERMAREDVDRDGDPSIGYVIAHEALGRPNASPFRYGTPDPWPERFPWLGLCGAHLVRREWSAVRALAACDVHLLGIDRGTVTLGIVAVAE